MMVFGLISRYWRVALVVVFAANVAASQNELSLKERAAEKLSGLLTGRIEDGQNLDANILEAKKIATLEEPLVSQALVADNRPMKSILIELTGTLDVLANAAKCNEKVVKNLAYFQDAGINIIGGTRRIDELVRKIVARLSEKCEAFLMEKIKKTYDQFNKTDIRSWWDEFEFVSSRFHSPLTGYPEPDWTRLDENILRAGVIDDVLGKLARNDPLCISYNTKTKQMEKDYEVNFPNLVKTYLMDPCSYLVSTFDDLIKALLVIKQQAFNENTRKFLVSSPNEFREIFYRYRICKPLLVGTLRPNAIEFGDYCNGYKRQ